MSDRGRDVAEVDFLAALAPVMTDADARDRFLADPRTALADAGLEFPDFITITAIEADVVQITVTLPALIAADAELTEESLAMVSGGCGTGGCTKCGKQWSASCRCE